MTVFPALSFFCLAAHLWEWPSNDATVNPAIQRLEKKNSFLKMKNVVTVKRFTSEIAAHMSSLA